MFDNTNNPASRGNPSRGENDFIMYQKYTNDQYVVGLDGMLRPSAGVGHLDRKQVFFFRVKHYED